MRKRLSAVFVSVALAGASLAPAAHAQSSSLQCAQFARLFSGIQIFGDAASWWRQAMGKYARGFTPETGSVLVFRASGVMAKGHVAVVSHVLTDRIIQVTHANWSMINGHRGQIEKDVTVVDVSPTGDWSQVKVWYDPNHNLGTTIYPTYGFVYRAAQQAANVATRIASGAAASASSAAVTDSSAATSLGLTGGN
ncbi:CHAP domain-containing protein [Caulobacter sp. S45]|jgi:surface antigen|uniref:CHAP domain-containing protein n=1 Tax=Caulobacter sp. S45 TaxID=1641861 RepID=UPI00131DF628|nr:CHAP domain-containing protein [Caulobacter sp. S45]